MTVLSIDDETLTLDSPGWERLMAGRRSHCVPRSAIESVEYAPGWTSEILGVRSGLVVSGVRMLGSFRHLDGTRRLVSMTWGLPLLRVLLRSRELGGGFDELFISDARATELAVRLTAQPS